MKVSRERGKERKRTANRLRFILTYIRAGYEREYTYQAARGLEGLEIFYPGIMEKTRKRVPVPFTDPGGMNSAWVEAE